MNKRDKKIIALPKCYDYHNILNIVVDTVLWYQILNNIDITKTISYNSIRNYTIADIIGLAVQFYNNRQTADTVIKITRKDIRSRAFTAFTKQIGVVSKYATVAESGKGIRQYRAFTDTEVKALTSAMLEAADGGGVYTPSPKDKRKVVLLAYGIASVILKGVLPSICMEVWTVDFFKASQSILNCWAKVTLKEIL